MKGCSIDVTSNLEQKAEVCVMRGQLVVPAEIAKQPNAAPLVTPPSQAVKQGADASVCRIGGMRTPIPGGPLPQYDSGDGEHFNAAGTDLIAGRAAPDGERVLMQHGFEPGH